METAVRRLPPTAGEELRGLLERLGYRLEPAAIRRNVDYYLERTSHGSTLSGVVNAWVLARSDRPGSWRFFTEALGSDLHDVQGGTTAEGIHLGAMAGTVDIVLRCLTGLRARGEALRFDPALPPQVKQLRFSVHYRHHRLDVTLAEDRLQVSSRPGEGRPIQIHVQDETIHLVPGARHEFSLEQRP